MSETQGTREILLPCPGFSDTWIEGLIDSWIDAIVERILDRSGGDLEKVSSSVSASCDFFKVFEDLARSYSLGCNVVVHTATGLDLGIQFASVQYPKEYNYENDKVFASVDPGIAQRLFEISAENGHSVLERIVRDECSDHEGFYSYYSSDLQEWLKKPFENWDWWELTLCVRAGLEHLGVEWDDIDDKIQVIFEHTSVVVDAICEAIDWREV